MRRGLAGGTSLYPHLGEETLSPVRSPTGHAVPSPSLTTPPRIPEEQGHLMLVGCGEERGL